MKPLMMLALLSLCALCNHDPSHAGTKANRSEYPSKDETRSTSLRMDGEGAWDTLPQRCLELDRERWEEARRN